MMRPAFSSTSSIVFPLGEKYGTIEVDNIEITTYRSEGGYTDRRHPDEVRFERDFEKDLSRRDFTINAMALGVVPHRNGYYVKDLFGGQKDIELKRIKAVGNADTRFKEDALRMLRAIRFAGRLGFLIEDETFHSIQRNASLLNEISGERIRDELLKILGEEKSDFGLAYLKDSCVLKVILPEVAVLEGITQNPQFHAYDVLGHTFSTVSHLPNKPMLRLAGLLHDVGKVKKNPEPPNFPEHAKIGNELLDTILPRLKLSTYDSNYIRFLCNHHMDIVLGLGESRTDKSVRRWLARLGENIVHLEDLLALIEADNLGAGVNRDNHLNELYNVKKMVYRILSEKPPLSVRDLQINGYDLMNLNVPASRIMGKILSTLLNEVIDEKTPNERETLLRRATLVYQELIRNGY